MEGRILCLLLKTLGLSGLLSLALGISAASAAEPVQSDQDQVIQPEVERRDLVLPEIDTEDFEVGAYVGVLSIEDFGTNVVYGARAAYHVTEGFFVEAALGQSKGGETSFETLSGNITLLTDDQRTFTYYNVSLGYDLFPGEAFLTKDWAFTTDFYVIGGIGSTEFAGDKHFTVNVGAGYRFLANDWLAFHVDFRDHIFDMDLLGEQKTTNNLEMHGGLTVFF